MLTHRLRPFSGASRVSRELTVVPDVLGAFERVSRLPYPILFDSASEDSEVSRYSFVAAGPRTIVRGWGSTVAVLERDGGVVWREGRALDVVGELLKRGDSGELGTEADLPPFRGGAAGYIGYEYGGVLERVPRPSEGLGIPDVVMGIYDWTVAWDRVAERCWIFAESVETVEMVAAMIGGVSAVMPASLGGGDRGLTRIDPESFTSTFTRRGYEDAVERVREYIRAGDIFQANLSQQFSAPLRATPWALYRALRAVNPAPFASYYDVGDAVMISASPERFLLMDPAGSVETRPIKGTRPRDVDTARDDAQRDELLQSVKDAAEHVMIVDVLRNDLSRVCEYGSVRVPALMWHAAYATVHHLVSTITGQLRLGFTAMDLLHAAFPGGSITGAPKIRAMEIIAELEPVTRGVYCGAIGYVSVTGAMDTSIAIRTCVVHAGRVHFSAGGGIVADSDPAEEYDETLVKASALMRAVTAVNAEDDLSLLQGTR